MADHSPIVAILQARMSSSRLPGKVLKPILGAPMLLRQIERVLRAKSLDRLVVATSDDPSDDVIADLCSKNGVDSYRGSLRDVLDRYYNAALLLRPAHIVRLTGDCPMADPAVIDQVVRFYLDGSYDYASNSVEPTFPNGLDVEVFSLACLESTWKEAKLPSEREHVTLFMYRHPDRFRIGQYKTEPNLAHLRWTVDEAADFEFVSRVFEALYPTNAAFAMADVVEHLKRNPQLLEINAGIRRNEGLRRSLEEDKKARAGK